MGVERVGVGALPPVLDPDRGFRVRQAARLLGGGLRRPEARGRRRGEGRAFGGEPEDVLEGERWEGSGGRRSAPEGEAGGGCEEEESCEPAHRVGSVTPSGDRGKTGFAREPEGVSGAAAGGEEAPRGRCRITRLPGGPRLPRTPGGPA